MQKTVKLACQTTHKKDVVYEHTWYLTLWPPVVIAYTRLSCYDQYITQYRKHCFNLANPIWCKINNSDMHRLTGDEKSLTLCLLTRHALAQESGPKAILYVEIQSQIY